MDSKTLSPKNPEERVVWLSIVLTYGFYLIGALYIVAPVMGWCLLLLLAHRAWQSKPRDSTRANSRLPIAIWIWAIGMLVMLLVLLVGHLDFKLGPMQTIKSSIGWAKGWALLAVFLLLGQLNIRPELVYRAAMHVCLHTLLLLPLFIGAWLLGLPQTPYISPLQIVGGPGPEFFALSLYEIDPGSGYPRWRLFTPWAPALGFVANIYFVFALQETHTRWRRVGIVGSITMALLSGSRLALLALLTVWLSTAIIRRLRHPATPFVAASGATLVGLIAVPLIDLFDHLWQTFRSARIGSTRVRETLGRIAVERWSSEAPVWGHGVVERGPHLVEYMLFGSHHTWFGLLFVKGSVGMLALATPLIYSTLQLSWWSDRLPIARVGLAMLLLLFLYTFGENLEVLAYLIWPALLLAGIAHRDVDATARRDTSNSTPLNGDFTHAKN